jgi:hypothetical protein
MARTIDLSLHHRVQASSEFHPLLYPMRTGAVSLRVKRLRHEADHSPRTSAVVENGGAIPPFRHPLSWSGA